MKAGQQSSSERGHRIPRWRGAVEVQRALGAVARAVRQDGTRRAAARALWAAMLALHCWPLAGVAVRIASGEGGYGALAMLLATQALFVAKLVDVRWLRLPSRRGAVLTFVLATCFAHPEAALLELGHASQSAAGVAALAAAPAVARSRPRRWQRWLAARLRAAARATAPWRDLVGAPVLRSSALAPVSVAAPRTRLGRAPPHSSLR